MQRFLAVAQELRGRSSRLTEAADRRLAGDVGEALEILEQAPSSGDPFVDFARNSKPAKSATPGAMPGVPERSSTSCKRRARRSRDRTWTKPRAAATLPGTGGCADRWPAADAAIVAEHLFRKENYSFDTMEIFEAEYEGKTVSWSGDLKRLRRLRSRPRLRGWPRRSRRYSAIAVLGTDLYAGRDVDAIVRLPHGAEDEMKIGGRYSFRGILSRCDPAMRNLFVTDAILS